MLLENIRASVALALFGFIAILPCAEAQDETAKIPRLGLITSYQRETSELVKRDLALKIIDSGILKIHESTVDDIAKIFGRDWAPDLKVDSGECYGIVSFKQARDSVPGHVAGSGWYMVIYYRSADRKVFDWDLSNVHH